MYSRRWTDTHTHWECVHTGVSVDISNYGDFFLYKRQQVGDTCPPSPYCPVCMYIE